MKHLLFRLLFIFAAISTSSLYAEKVKIVAAYSWISSIASQIAGDLAQVETLASGNRDPHYIVPRPSYIAKLRDADLLITNGADLEIGWMPPLIRQSGNAKLSGKGKLELSQFVELAEIPRNVSRTEGDVHPEGNPHFILDPENVIPVARAIQQRLAEIDPPNAAAYSSNFMTFSKKWKDKIINWEKQMGKIKGQYIVQYHGLFNYFLRRYGILQGATIERLPGIGPTPRHLESVEKSIREKNVKIIILDVYNPDDASRMLAGKMNLKTVVLPHDVGSVSEAKDIFYLFDEMVRRLTND